MKSSKIFRGIVLVIVILLSACNTVKQDFTDPLLIIDAYRKNEAKADNLYKGQRIRTFGYVVGDYSSGGDVYIYLAPKNYTSLRFKCENMTESEKSKLRNFDNGQKIFFIGIVMGQELHGGLGNSHWIKFDNCEFPEY